MCCRTRDEFGACSTMRHVNAALYCHIHMLQYDERMRKSVAFTRKTLEVAERVSSSEAYRAALISNAGGGAVSKTESGRLRQLADIGAAVVAEAAEEVGYQELAVLYEVEGELYKSFQDPALAAGPEDSEEDLARLFKALGPD